ncbi:MAG: hypothetical protein OEV55_00305 [candidate division Zixibacteria bacterium]|nr:hypothetical protein [candidate division Zixibacteria bacterium]
MLRTGIKRGFTKDKLSSLKESRVKKDEGGFYVLTFNENAKVYFDDYYQFLEKVEQKCLEEKKELEKKILQCDSEKIECLSYYRAKKIIVDQVLRYIYSYYIDSSDLGVIMTPWCFGTVILEKIESYRDKLSRGEVNEPNISEYPYFVLKYLEEIYKKTLLDLFGFPEKAFSIRWQYSELLKRYSNILSNIRSSLQSILLMVKSYGTP